MAKPSSQGVRRQNPWVSISCGIGVAFLGYCFFRFCDGLEKGTTDPQSVPALFAFLYRLGGRWFAAGAIIVLGGLAIWSGIRDLSRSWRDEEAGSGVA